MSSFVRLSASNYASFAHLAEGILTGTSPHKLRTGSCFWQWLRANPDRQETFNLAMLQIKHIGAAAVAQAIRRRGFEAIIDVGGGEGGIMADLLQGMPCPSLGVVFDTRETVNVAQKLWSHKYPTLLPRVKFVGGDIFGPGLVPTPPADSHSTAYLLCNVLHNWSDAACVQLLRSIRDSAGDAPGVRLLVAEFSTVSDVLPFLQPPRHSSDLAMLVNFGDGRERNRQQFEALFKQSGWGLHSITPTNSPFLITEAVPMLLQRVR